MRYQRATIIAFALFIMALLGVAAGLLAVRGGALLDEPAVEVKK